MGRLGIAFRLLEGLALAFYIRATGRGEPPAQFGLNLVSGLCLMFALRCALGGAALPWVAAWLLASGLVHAADLWRHWQKKNSPPA